jgi:virginiamycin A acetyltransferase
MRLNARTIYPNPALKGVCYINNVIKNPLIQVGDYTYYSSDEEDCLQFERHVTYHYDFYDDHLIIGRYCAIATGVEFIMNGSNHIMKGITTYPFGIFGIESAIPTLEDLPNKGDTVIGNDVWIGQHVTFLPGIKVGNGVIIAASSVVTQDVPAYHIVGGNPAKIIGKRFDPSIVERLESLQWWQYSFEKIEPILPLLFAEDLHSAIDKLEGYFRAL